MEYAAAVSLLALNIGRLVQYVLFRYSAAQRDNLLRLDTNQEGAITLEEAKRLRR